MILTIKLSSLAYNIYDGTVRKTEIETETGKRTVGNGARIVHKFDSDNLLIITHTDLTSVSLSLSFPLLHTHLHLYNYIYIYASR